MAHYEIKNRSLDSPILIRGVVNSLDGVRAEHACLCEKFGERGRDWDLEMQTLIEGNGRHYDRVEIKLSDGTKKKVVFDITEFYSE